MTKEMMDRELCKKVHKYVDKSIEVIATRLDGIDTATKLKTIEIDRRLNEHNELRKEVITDRVYLLRKDTYENDKNIFDEWKVEVNKKLTELDTKDTNKISKSQWIAIVMVLITIINTFLLIFHVI